MKPLTLSRTFPYLLNFSSISSNLVKCLALPYFSISLIKISLLRAHFNILKLHLIAPKHIPISFSISLAIPHFLENNITNVITRKTTPAATISSSIYYIYPSYYLSHTSIYFTNTFLTNYPYTLLTYISNLSYKHHISQNIYISYHLHIS